jgi:glycosyltransferase involved in cell wall biosynthesis
MNAFMGFHTPRDGYGYSTRKIADQLRRLAPEIDLIDMRPAKDGGFVAAEARHYPVDGTAVLMGAPEWLAYIHSARRANFTMFEATRLLQQRVDEINRYANVCIVPCRWNAETFRDSGVMVPIRVVGLGIDSDDFPLLDRRPDRPYTFLWSGTGDQRKGWDLAYRAFHAAGFADRKDVRLVMHFRNMPRAVNRCQDKNVTLVKGSLPDEMILDSLACANCYLFPSRGEGWGLPPREAAATGLPVIATNFGGLAEGIAHWALPLQIAGLSHADYGFWTDDVGEWAEPDFDHLVELMSWCFENRASALNAPCSNQGGVPGNCVSHSRTNVCALLRASWQKYNTPTFKCGGGPG